MLLGVNVRSSRLWNAKAAARPGGVTGSCGVVGGESGCGGVEMATSVPLNSQLSWSTRSRLYASSTTHRPPRHAWGGDGAALLARGPPDELGGAGDGCAVFTTCWRTVSAAVDKDAGTAEEKTARPVSPATASMVASVEADTRRMRRRCDFTAAGMRIPPIEHEAVPMACALLGRPGCNRAVSSAGASDSVMGGRSGRRGSARERRKSVVCVLRRN